MRDVVRFGSIELGLRDITLLFESKDIFEHTEAEKVFEPNMYKISLNVQWIENTLYKCMIRVAL